MEGNPIVAVFMFCSMLCLAIWPLFLAGLVAAAGLAYFHQWIAAALVAIPAVWILGLRLYTYITTPYK